MRKITLILLMVLLNLALSAQFKIVAESDVFDEPEQGVVKILQMKNGYTMYFRVTINEGIEVKVFDDNYKIIISRHLPKSFEDLKALGVEGVFEISGNAVLMIVEDVDDQMQVLSRIIVDGKTGELKDAKKIASVTKLSIKPGQVFELKVRSPPFNVRKDPKSDHYAVAVFNNFERDPNKRMEIFFFGPDHTELSRALYVSPKDKYEFIQYLDMAVIGNKTVSMLAYAFHTVGNGLWEKHLVLANLENGSDELSMTRLDISNEVEILRGIVRFNPTTQKLIVLATVLNGNPSGEIIPFIAIVDPFTGTLIMNDNVYPRQAVDMSEEVFGKKYAFRGTPQNLYIHNDGTFSIIYEEIINHLTSGVRLNNLAIAYYNISGTPTRSYFIPKSHYIHDFFLPSFYVSAREITGQRFYRGNQFKAFVYLNGTDKNYVLFNDLEKNRHPLVKGKITTFQSVSDCEAYYFNVSGSEVMPQRQYLFEKPGDTKERNRALFTVSEYDQDKNIFVTLKLENERGNKGVKVVWMQPG